MSKSITDFYAKNTNKEWTRLERHPLEFPITYRHINEIIGNDKFVIADIGGGPGRYSIELSKSGNEVTLVDLTPENIEFAKNKANELNIPINNFIVGDARKLISLSDNRFDLTLLLGPLYHLLDHNDRIQAINEALRITKKNGIVFLGFISRYAPIYDLLKRIPEEQNIRIEHIKEMYQKTNNINVFENNGFTDAHFMDPTEIDELLKNFNIELVKKFGAESIMSQSDFKLKDLNKDEFNKWLDFGYELSTHQAGVLGSEHIICVIRKIS